MRVALFITCFNDTIFPNTGKAVVRLLERLGHTVEFPMEQTCCGQMHYNTGYQREAVPIVGHFLKVFGDAEVVVSPSASCVGMVREMYPHAAELAGDESLKREVKRVGAKVFELSEFLVKVLGVEDVGAYFPHRVTYHPTCHSLRAIRVGDAPLKLLRAVRGIDLVELPRRPRSVAGSAARSPSRTRTRRWPCSGTSSGASWTPAPSSAPSADNSCLMHIGGRLETPAGRGRDSVHLAEVLASTEGDPPREIDR